MTDKVEILLRKGPDDPPTNDRVYLAEIGRFAAGLTAAGVRFSQRGMAFDAVGTEGFPLGEFVFATVVAAPVLIPIAVEWLKGRRKRSIVLKVGDVAITANSIEEIDHFLARYVELTGQTETLSGISAAGQVARFARWEEIGFDAIRQDLADGGFRYVGGPPEVRQLAREWVRSKEGRAGPPMQLFVSWITREGKLTRFAHAYSTLDSALEFACEGFALNCKDIWVEDKAGQKVADRIRVAQYADRHGKPYN